MEKVSKKNMPNVKFIVDLKNENIVDFLGFNKINHLIATLGRDFKYGYTNPGGNVFYTNKPCFENDKTRKLVSIYEAIPELIPDGMRYNKEFNKLVPDVISGYVKDITIPFDEVKEEMLQRENGFIKADKEKINFSLVDPYAYEDLGKCLTIGAKKYSPDNWKLGDIESYIAALDRHLIDIKKAVLDKDKSLFIDKDTTLQHGANLLCNAMFIHYFIRKELEEDKC